MSDALVLLIDLLPLLLESLPELIDFLLRKGVFVLRDIVLHVLDHFVFAGDVILDLLQVVRVFSIIRFVKPVLFHFGGFRNRQDVFDSVGDDEVFVRTEPLHRFILHGWNSLFFVTAIIRILSN